MKIKNWIEFSKITESNGADVQIWKLSKDDIRDYLRDAIDEGYIVTAKFGKKTEDGLFSEKLLAGIKFEPACRIRIEEGRAIGSEDVTDSIRFAADMIKDEIGADVEILVEDGEADISEVMLKDGIFLLPDEDPAEYIDMLVFEKTEAKLNMQQLADYYSWTGYTAEGSEIFLDIEVEDLADLILSRKSPYKDLLIKGHEGTMHYNFYGGDYQPDLISLFKYYINKENAALLIKALFKEQGGYEEVSSQYDRLKGMSEEEAIKMLLSERFYATLEQISEDSEIVGDIKQIYGDWAANAHADQNLQDIYDEFDYIVGKCFSFKKEQREVRRHYIKNPGKADQERVEYTDHAYFYLIRFDNEWISEAEMEEIENGSLNELFERYINNSYDFNYELKPSFSDYGDVDSKSFNSEVAGIISHYLSKK
jgi:hypothetical protein